MSKKALLLGSLAAAVMSAVATAPIALAVPKPAHSRHPVPASAAGAITTLKSSYWAGYVADAPPNHRNDYFKYVTATFTVPAISSCSAATSADVAQYAGLSGYWEPGGDPLQAAGVYETCQAGSRLQPVYYGAYWNVGANGASDDQPGQAQGPTELFPVSPGDVIFASVSFSGPPPSATCGGLPCQEYDTWRLTDQTTGQKWTQKLPCNTGDISEGVSSCDTNTAEVISQGEPGNAGPAAGTPPFGQVNFSAIKVTDYKQTSARSMVSRAWTTMKVVEYGTRTFQPDVMPGTLTSTTQPPLESAFTNTWKGQQ